MRWSTSAAIANLLGSILAAQTSLENANINARTQEAVADKYKVSGGTDANYFRDIMGRNGVGTKYYEGSFNCTPSYCSESIIIEESADTSFLEL